VNPRQVRWQRSAVSLPNLFLGRWAVSRCLDCRLLLFFRLLFCERGFYILDGEQQLIAISTAQPFGAFAKLRILKLLQNMP